MKRFAAVLLAACTMLSSFVPAARAQSQAVEPFPTVPLDIPEKQNYWGAYLACIGGASLVGLSFAFTHRADHAYDEYLASTDPEEIQALYDRAAHYDHLSQASLLTGEALIATGLYLRFIRRPPHKKVAFSVEPSRCAVTYRF
jgi:hypothetical protein